MASQISNSVELTKESAVQMALKSLFCVGSRATVTPVNADNRIAECEGVPDFIQHRRVLLI
jgi:hypothetical protein